MWAEGTGDMASDEGELLCRIGCGRSFKKDGAWKTGHELKCKGKVQTRGRIERLAARRQPRTQRALAVVHHRRARHANGHAPAPGVGAIQAAATDTAIDVVLAGLHAQRERIDTAIASLEALRT